MISEPLNKVDSGVLLLLRLLAAHSLYFDLDVGTHDGFVLLVPVHVVEAWDSDLGSSACRVGRSRHCVIVACQMRSQDKLGVFDAVLIQFWLRRFK